MTNSYSIINFSGRKPRQHLRLEERGAIQALKKLGYSNRAISKELMCSPSTIGYELKRGTLGYSGRGRKPVYSAKRGEAVYQSHRKNCRRPKTVPRNSSFIKWMIGMIRFHKWSFDTCVGRARREKLFPKKEIPCTKTLYNLLWKKELPMELFEFPEVLMRRKRGQPRIPKRRKGKGIDQRPPEVLHRNTFGHWESDTVLGRKNKEDPAIFTIVERMTGYYLTFKIEGKTVKGVSSAMNRLHEQYEEHFSEVFKTITTDNGSEFADFSEAERFGTQIYFAEPYSAWERPVNERTNRILRRYMPKGVSMKQYSEEQILQAADEINSMPRKRLGYATPEELFDDKLDQIYHI